MLQRKKYFVLLALVFISTLAFAQKNLRDAVYLKNGSIIRGIIIEQILGKSIKIQTADNNVFVYQMDEIEKITKETKNGNSYAAESRDNSATNNRDNSAASASAAPIAAFNSRDNSFNNSSAGLKSGYKGIAEAGFLFGVGQYVANRQKIDVINGYQINPYLSLGFGAGVRRYRIDNLSGYLFPIYGDLRVNFTDSKISPYLSVDAGYSFGNTAVGLFLSPAAGVTMKIARKTAVNIGLGYEMQRFSIGYLFGNVDYHAISFVTSFSF